MINPLKCLLFFLLLSIISCGPIIVFEKVVPIENAAWKYNDQVNFEFEAPNLAGKYNLLLTLKHSNEFAYQNTYVKIQTIFPSGKKEEQSLSLNLADKQGKWMGQCSGKSCEATIALQMNTTFTESGKYQIVLTQDSRENPLEGIHSLTFQIEAVEKS